MSLSPEAYEDVATSPLSAHQLAEKYGISTNFVNRIKRRLRQRGSPQPKQYNPTPLTEADERAIAADERHPHVVRRQYRIGMKRYEEIKKRWSNMKKQPNTQVTKEVQHPVDKPREAAACSFCGAARTRLITGINGAYICESCADLSQSVFKSPINEPPPAVRPSAADLAEIVRASKEWAELHQAVPVTVERIPLTAAIVSSVIAATVMPMLWRALTTPRKRN